MRAFVLALLFSFAALTATFEVVSIKPSDPAEQGYTLRLAPGGRVGFEGATVKSLIGQAFGVRDFQIVGAAGWTGSERYDVVATAEASAGPITMESLKPMLQEVLADRFSLKLQRETRELPRYRLIVAKGGSKLHQNTGAPGPDGRGHHGQLTDRKVTIAMFAGQLADEVDRPIVDETKLSGEYDVQLTWTPDDANIPDPGPSIFTALEEQLGLKLESDKGPVEILVIENVQRPSAN